MSAFELAPYSGSVDYARLAELAKTHSVICFFDDENGREVGRTNYQALSGNREHWSVVTRGRGYIYAMDRADFISLCRWKNLEFLEPLAALPDELV